MSECPVVAQLSFKRQKDITTLQKHKPQKTKTPANTYELKHQSSTRTEH